MNGMEYKTLPIVRLQFKMSDWNKEKILQKVQQDGYCFVGKVSEEENKSLCLSLGQPVQRTAVKLSNDNRDVASFYKKVPFHNDCPEVDIINWYCVEQENEGGDVQYLDSSDILNSLSAKDIEGLQSLSTNYRTFRDKGADLHKTSILTIDGNKTKVYFTPWLRESDYSEEQAELLGRFRSYLKNLEETKLISIPIKKGESIFVDNTRLLHGRQEISPTSKRTLFRTWLKI